MQGCLLKSPITLTPALRVLPYRQIAAEVAERLVSARGADPLAPWVEEVVVPSAGMSQAIARELLQRLPNGIAALQLQSIETLAQRVVNAAGEYPRVASEAERRLAMRAAVRAIDHPMMESRGIAAMLERSYRDVRDSGLTLADLKPSLMLRAWREYERHIARLGAIDAADLLRRATELANTARPQLIAGFYDMTFAQRRFVEALDVKGMWIPTGLTLPGGLLQTPQATDYRQPTTDHRAHDTRETEFHSVCAQIAELLANGTAPHDIGIVARSFEPYDAALLERFAAEHGFRTTLAVDIPLTAHRIGRGAITLLRLREREFPRADVFELVRDGLRVTTALNVDTIDAATRRARIAGGTSAELASLRGRPFLDSYIDLVAELERLTAKIDIAELSSMFHLDTELDLAAADALDEIATLFKRFGSHDAASVIDAIENVTLRQPATDNQQPVVHASDVLRFRGRSFQHLFVVRMQDDVFPQRRIEDPLLPDADRRALGIREIGDGADEEKLLFQLLLYSSENVTFSFAASDGFGKVLRVSRFARHAVVGSRLSVVSEPITHRQPTTNNRQLQLLVRSGTRSTFDGYLTRVSDQIKARLHAISPTQLEDFGECPQKFLIKHLLGARDIDDPDRELQLHHREKGKLDHRILESFYRALRPEELARAEQHLPRVEPALVERLHAIVDDAFDALDIESPPFNRTMRDMERRATKRILGDFVARDFADLAASGLAPIEFESHFGPFTIDAHGIAVRVEGTIDRIDAGATRYRIVDYKSGKALRHKDLDAKIDRGVRLQLALYAMAAAERFAADPERVSGTIKPIVPGGAKPEKYAFELAAKAPRLRETLDLFVAAIAAGAFPAFPNDNDDQFNSCKYCPVTLSCRTKHDAEERFGVQQFKDPRTLLQSRKQKAESRDEPSGDFCSLLSDF